MMATIATPTPIPPTPILGAGNIHKSNNDQQFLYLESRLTDNIKNALSMQSFTTAIYFADKLLTLYPLSSKKYADQLFLLCSSLYLDKQFQRASFLLTKYLNSIDKSGQTKCNQYQRLTLKHLAAKCKIETNEYDQCLQILGGDNDQNIINDDEQDDDIDDIDDSTDDDQQQQDNVIPFLMTDNNKSRLDNIKILRSNICMIRGKCFESMDNFKKARYWYIQSLLLDYNCYESFESLSRNHLLNYSEELELIDRLNFKAQDQWLKDLYLISLKKYDSVNQNSNTKILDTLIQLNNENIDDNNSNNNDNDNYKYFLSSNDVQTCIAEYNFYHHQFSDAYSITKKILKQDNYYNNQICLMVHISSMFELQKTNELYYTCNQLIENFTQSPISWYGVASYYQLIQNYELSLKFFTKSTSIDSRIGPSWLAFGHHFANKGEHDQAMAAYRTSSRLLTGCHLPLLCIGMELIRVHNLSLASQYLLQAKDICEYDPIIYNELGIIEYKNGKYQEAIVLFQKALDISTFNNQSSNGGEISESWEPTIYNVAHCYRKLRQFNQALKYYNMSLSLSPNNPSVFTAIGFTHHLEGKLDDAIDIYHQSLSLRDDTFTNVLLQKALSLSILEYD
ncbi:hypothetical protein CYY_004321 [Polysphondylium violaceum]|uniref:Anaphase promoting complex subunit 6 n=1 Tax=Polysphondylium violaceum TaxID=133409 RepID=A0A8J4V5D3_9MYCE|nr:hypothetical protein CYY_004321 [Polysphondylium violaceum]